MIHFASSNPKRDTLGICKPAAKRILKNVDKATSWIITSDSGARSRRWFLRWPSMGPGNVDTTELPPF